MSIETSFRQHTVAGSLAWLPRTGSHRENGETIWSPFGVYAECGRLRSVLLHRPGAEVEAIVDPGQVLWKDVLLAEQARIQHDALASLYRSYGVTVQYVEHAVWAKPNLYFMKDTFAMTPEGAILARPASRIRAGEERIVAQTLIHLGIPIVLSVHGHGTFEGADLILVNEDLAFVGCGLRTNSTGARQVEQFLSGIGIANVVRADLHDDCLHLDCALAIVDRHLALLDSRLVSPVVRETLLWHGFRVIEVPWQETDHTMAINMVALAPGLVVMPAQNVRTRTLLERQGVTCLEVDISELMKGGGAVHCVTGVLQRDMV